MRDVPSMRYSLPAVYFVAVTWTVSTLTGMSRPHRGALGRAVDRDHLDLGRTAFCAALGRLASVYLDTSYRRQLGRRLGRGAVGEGHLRPADAAPLVARGVGGGAGVEGDAVTEDDRGGHRSDLRRSGAAVGRRPPAGQGPVVSAPVTGSETVQTGSTAGPSADGRLARRRHRSAGDVHGGGALVGAVRDGHGGRRGAGGDVHRRRWSACDAGVAGDRQRGRPASSRSRRRAASCRRSWRR